jgi:tRNA(His) 5'-end guanylyltransferase
VLASLATAKFNALVPELVPAKKDVLAVFDARVWTVPNEVEAANVLLWREKDATKNSISMAARAVHSHRELEGKSSSEQQEMLFQKGINWNDYPAFFKRGTFVRRRTVLRPLETEVLARVPEAHRPAVGTLVERSEVIELEMPPFTKVVNRAGVIFAGEEPRSQENKK